MPACRRYLEGALGMFLAAHLAEVRGPVRAVRGHGRRLVDRDGNDAREVVRQTRQRLDRNDVHPVDQRGLGGIGCRDEQPTESLGPAQRRHRQDAGDMPDRAVQREFSDDEGAVEAVGADLFGSDQGAHGDGEIVGRSFLPQRRRCQVDRQPLARECQAGVLDRRLDPFAALLNSRVRKPHNREGGEPARRVHFYFDDCPLQPDDGAGVDLGEHRP